MTMLVVVMVLMVMVFTVPSEGCVNSCCQACLPEQCDVCYKLNNNPVMCPCVGEIGVTSDPVTRQGTQSSQPDKIKAEFSRLSKYQLLSQKSQISVGELGHCKPKCCQTSCTPNSCPLCYRRALLSPRTCPCR